MEELGRLLQDEPVRRLLPTADQVTLEDIDPLHGEHAHGWWYIGLRLDVTTYSPERQDFDVVLVSDEEPRGGELDAPLATPGGCFGGLAVGTARHTGR